MTSRVTRAALCLLIFAPSMGWAQPSGKVQVELDAVAEAVVEMEQRFLAAALLEHTHRITAKISDGLLFFHMKDFDRAAMVLLDVVENPGIKQHPGYRDALYHLAESLFRARNFNAAARFFAQISVEGTGPQQQQAIGRLLEIALQTRDAETAQIYLARARGVLDANPDPTILYAVGKYYYRSGQMDLALGMFTRIPAGHAVFLRARYFLGVVELKAGRLDAASAAFAEVAKNEAGADDPEARSVRALAQLALARLQYEKGEFDDALASYTMVPRDSVAFDEALYESVWIAIKQQDYEKALRKLEVQFISEPDVLKGPDARLLQGQLLMMLDRYSDASLAFQEVLFEFGPIQSDMAGVIRKSRGDLEAYFNRVIGKNIEAFDLKSFLPAKVAEFAGPDAEADRALLLVSDLAAQRRDVLAATLTIERLEVAILADNRIEIFPKLHQGWLRAVELQARLASARGELNAQAASQAQTDASYDRLRVAREQAYIDFRNTPRTAVELRARDARVDDEMQRIDEAAFKLELEIRAMEAQLSAIDKYIDDVSGEGTISVKDRSVRAQVALEVEGAQALRLELRALVSAIESERQQVGANDPAAQRDHTIQSGYLKAIREEARWLGSHGVSPDGAALARISRLEGRVASFMTRAGQIVDERVKDIRRQLTQERKNVVEYERYLGNYRGQTESLGGAIAVRSFRHVLEQIDSVVLQADVGLIDVSWKQKEDTTKKISDMLGRKRVEIDALDQEFSEVVGD